MEHLAARCVVQGDHFRGQLDGDVAQNMAQPDAMLRRIMRLAGPAT